MKLFANWDEIETIHLETMDRKIFTGENVMIVRNEIFPKVVVPMHNHYHEQMLYILSGECDVITDGETKHLKAGEMALFPSDAEHSVVNTLDEMLVAIDIFSPIREDFLK